MTAMIVHKDPIGKTQSWLTPPPILEALGGWEAFDLDPCCPPVDMPWPTAREMWHEGERDGLAEPWPAEAFIWLNPPYARSVVGRWLAKLADHPGGGLALVYARTDVEWAQRFVFSRARAVCFLAGRVTFRAPDGTPAPSPAGAPSMVVAYRPWGAEKLVTSGLKGAYVLLGN